MSIQMMLLGTGAVATKTYVDDIFSTNVYTGTSSSTGSGTTQAINTGFDLASEGGLVWNKGRSFSDNHFLIDTVRGANKLLKSNQTASESTYSLINAFTSTGYTTTDDVGINGTGKTYASWTFRKAPGFFDVVTYNGSSSAQNISHSLGCLPGMIMVKKTSGTDAWAVWHRSLSNTAQGNLALNTDAASGNDSTIWNNTAPTSSVFSVGQNGVVNENGATYVAYLFAGGESTAATARSVELGGSSDFLVAGSSSDLTMGTGDFTAECWVKWKTNPSGHQGIFQLSSNSNGYEGQNHNDHPGVGYTGSVWRIYAGGGSGTVSAATASPVVAGLWYHVAMVRASSVTKLYINGTEVISKSDSHNYNGTYMGIGVKYGTSFAINAYISNVRLVKGTAVYTSAFRPPTEPLTNITNTKLLCCNNSSTTGKTVGPTITESGDSITASTDSPFDDPAAFTFGDAGDQNVIKCGSYTGNGSSTGPEINLGWEPQWLLIKSATMAKSWKLLDSMRGIVTNDMEAEMQADNNNAENTGADRIDLTSTGFKVKTTSPIYNNDGDTYIYICLRRSDGYVGKPVEAGTDVFAMDTGNSSSTIPNFDSTFPVDFAWAKIYAGSGNWWTSARLIQGKELKTNLTDAEANGSNKVFDSNVGWHDTNGDSSYISHMWKRHAGFDVVTYDGDGASARRIPHSLSKIPEMMWVKGRGPTIANWYVYHKALGNTRAMHLETADAQMSESQARWDNTTPTSTHFSIGANPNANNENYLAMLFSSVEGISSVGSYDGSNSTLQITTGFQPRLVIIKRYTANQGWVLVDSVNGDGKFFSLHGTDAAATDDLLDFNSTGFELTAGSAGGSVVKVNGSGESFIYYAHA